MGLPARRQEAARHVPLPGGMHAIFFGLKRAWHGTLRATRHPLAAFGLTAARFDLLYAAHTRGYLGSITQRELRHTLGVNRTTVSRMLGSLEALGLVTRERACGDRRTRRVHLTAQGRSRIRRAIARLIRSGAAQLAVNCAVVGGSWFNDSDCLHEADVFEAFLRRIRSAFRDRATLHYPWQPDD
jgi:DNA-binding MarR family transcriptional regulator